MTRTGRDSPEVRERAIRMVQEHECEHTSQWPGNVSIATRIDRRQETLRKWCRLRALRQCL